jgi:hypothetical protein
VFLLAGISIGTVAVGATRRALVEPLELSLPDWLPLALAAAWGLIWLVVGWGLWRLKPWARISVLILFPVYQLTTTGQQVLYAEEAYARGRLPFAVGWAMLLTLLFTLVLTRPRIRQAFGAARS